MESSDFGALASSYLQAQLAFDGREAVRLLVDEGFNRGASVASLLLDVIQPAQREIGRLWQMDRLTIACSAASRRSVRRRAGCRWPAAATRSSRLRSWPPSSNCA